MNIAIIYSPNWKEYAAISTYSIFKNNPHSVKVYLVSDADGRIDLSHICDHFGEGYQVEFIAADELYQNKIPSSTNVDSRFTKYALYRLLLPELINDDKLLYLDADTIVNGDISEFYNTNLGDGLIAGIEDIGAYTAYYDLKTPIGLSPTDIYVNAGVLLMNLKKIRDENIYERWICEVNNHFYICHDQCIINKTSKGKILSIDKKYNVSVSTDVDFENSKDPIILHYSGLYKAWDDSPTPHQDIWRKWESEYKSLFGYLI